MRKIINRLGEKRKNKFGIEMEIVGFRKANDIDVLMYDGYNTIIKNRKYDHFKMGAIISPYELLSYGVGYLGEGKYKTKNGGKFTPQYGKWHNMLKRCYNKKFQSDYPTYIGCSVTPEWHNFQTFAKWFDENYYEIEGQKMCLDKDILVKGNKIYSPNTCIFVSKRINVLFVKGDKIRGKYPIGVSYIKDKNKYVSRCKNGKYKLIGLGWFNTPEEAFNLYKISKEKLIKEVADEYEDQIPKKLYEAMYKYEVEITD